MCVCVHVLRWHVYQLCPIPADKNEQFLRRLSDGPYPTSPRNHYHPFHHPQYSDFMDPTNPRMMRKNSSINVLLDSTSSVVRNATANFSYLIGSARRASCAGDLDPSVQMSGNRGSLYLQSLQPPSNHSPRLHHCLPHEQTIPNEDQKRRRSVTIYDGKIPSPRSASPSIIPFDLITPMEAIENTNDPAESYVQIVLETPEQPNKKFFYNSASSSKYSSTENIYRYNNLSEQFDKPKRRSSFAKQSLSPVPISTQEKDNSKTIDDEQPFDPTDTYCVPPLIVEPMDFSFLEPILKGKSAEPPPSPSRTQSQSRSISIATTDDIIETHDIKKSCLNSILSSMSIGSNTSTDSSSCLSLSVEKDLPGHTSFETNSTVMRRKKNGDTILISNMKHVNNPSATLQVPL
ncbi:unnamed protein product [Didymodactylos carnosus]|uniref:Uncharacterized protein n=1 Tax=Didymodactylos carnosus TaxID=1234261 RepID=A0A8S2J8N2_9BILA|nr:unnamed protein product [Didymodactylos carnosus]CAF3796364.1 unnamed protein product [Didymodactylos carnosus]